MHNAHKTRSWDKQAFSIMYSKCLQQDLNLSMLNPFISAEEKKHHMVYIESTALRHDIKPHRSD